jgi:hypothetical protein
MRARRTLGLLLVPMAASAIACRAGREVPESGALLLRVQVASGTTAPDELRVYVYDDTGILWSDVREPAEGALVPQSAQTLGTILIQPGSTTGTLRLEVRGLAGGARVLDGLLTIAPAARAQGTFDLLLDPTLPPDGDGDGIPDQIDDCPAAADPDQLGCPTAVDAGDDGGDDGGTGCPASGCGAIQGAACAANADCASGFCADGVCCANACLGPCRSCNQPGSDGLCQGYPQGSDPELECASGTTCNGPGACGKVAPPASKANGELCAVAAECSSGFCTDGVCCGSACTDPCKSCGTGTCTVVKNTQDVPECAAPMTCNPHGKCVAGSAG